MLENVSLNYFHSTQIEKNVKNRTVSPPPPAPMHQGTTPNSPIADRNSKLLAAANSILQNEVVEDSTEALDKLVISDSTENLVKQVAVLNPDLTAEFNRVLKELRALEQDYDQLVKAISFSKHSLFSFSNETINPQVFDTALSSAKAKLNQFWTQYQSQCKDDVFQFHLLAKEAGLLFPPDFGQKDQILVERQFAQHSVLKRALEYLYSPASSSFPLQSYIAFLKEADVHRKLLIQYTQLMHPLELSEKLAEHLAAYICLNIRPDYAEKETLNESMLPLLKDFCERICIIYWMAISMDFRYYTSSPCVEIYQRTKHENRENLDGSDDVGTTVFCSLVAGFEDSHGNVVSKEIVLSYK